MSSPADQRDGRKVILPRRLKADVVDGAISAAILITPLLLGQALAGSVPDLLLRTTWLGILAAVLYSVFRDAAGSGTSWGKRTLGMTVIHLDDGRPCTSRQVWARDLLDLIPIVNVIDFLLMCIDPHGQKLMDKWLGVQLVEELAPVGVVRAARPAR